MYESRKVLYSFYIEPKTLDELARRASAEKAPLSQYVRQILEQHIATKKH